MVQTLIAKNTTYLTVSSLVQKLLAFWWFAYVAHFLGEDNLGKYTFAVTYTSIFVIIMNFGLIPVLTREGAKAQDQASFERQFQHIFTLKIVLTIVSIVAMFGVFYILNQFRELPEYTIMLVYLAAGIIVIDTFRSIFLAVLRARQQMHYEAIGQFFYQIVVVGCGILMFSLGYKAGGLILAIIIASLAYALYALVILWKKTNFHLRWRWDTGVMKKLLFMAAPFALADIFFKLNGSIDTVMLEYLAGDRYVSWYNIALKLTVTLTVIPGAFATAFFPAMSKAYVESKDELRTIFERSFIYLFMLSLPIAAGTAILADRIIAVAFPAFPAAIPSLQIFMTSLVFLFINYPIGNLLNAANRQLLNTMNMAIALVLNIVLNVLLIPRFTYMGATVAAVVSALTLVALGLPHVYHEIHFNVKNLALRLGKIIIAAVIMSLGLWLSAPYVPDNKIFLLGQLVLAVLLYGLSLMFVRGLTLTECRELWQALRHKKIS